MKYVALFLILMASAGCASKKIMRNCKTLNLGYFECENK